MAELNESHPPLATPRPKQWEQAAGRFALGPTTPIRASRADARTEGRLLAELLANATGLNLALTDAMPEPVGVGAVDLSLVSELAGIPAMGEKDEGYRIRIAPDGVWLEARTSAGLYYAGQTLVDLLVPEGEGYSLPAGTLSDWPDFTWRGLLIAPGQRFYPVSEVKGVVDRMARSKLNLLHLHLTDNVIFTPRLDSHPDLCGHIDKSRPDAREQCYSKEDLREIVAYAAERKVDILPAIEIPGHAMNVLANLPELRCDPESGTVSPSTMCIGRDETYRFIEDMARELAPIFPFPFFHIGTDEVEFTDLPEVNVFLNWRECRHCRKRMAQAGLRDERALFCDFVGRTRDVLGRYGKRLMMWNDQIDSGRPDDVTVPRDVLMHYWRIAEPGRGPWENCTYDALLELGFPVVNSWYPETYIDIYIKADRLAKWNPWAVPEVPEQRRAQVIGSTMCAWAGLELYERVLPSAVPFFADRVWNADPIADLQQFGRRVARHVLGPRMPDELASLYDALGGLILPLQLQESDLAHNETSLPGLTVAERQIIYQGMVEALDEALTKGTLLDPEAGAAYRKCLVWLLEQIRPAG